MPHSMQQLVETTHHDGGGNAFAGHVCNHATEALPLAKELNQISTDGAGGPDLEGELPSWQIRRFPRHQSFLDFPGDLQFPGLHPVTGFVPGPHGEAIIFALLTLALLRGHLTKQESSQGHASSQIERAGAQPDQDPAGQSPQGSVFSAG